jgi:hypothetical protein
MTAAGATIVMPAQPNLLAPEGCRQMNHQRGGAMEVQDSVVVKFVSAGRDGAGLHTAAFIDPLNCAFPPMTLFTAVDVQVGAFEFDGTEGLLRQCKRGYGGRSPMAVPGADGRPRVGRAQLLEWLVEDHGPTQEAGYLLSPDSEYYQNAIYWFHGDMLPPGVESTIYTVNRTLVTVQATYLLPAAAAAAVAAAAAAAAAAAGGGAAVPALTAAAAAAAAGGGGGPGSAGDAVHAKLMADSTQLG